MHACISSTSRPVITPLSGYGDSINRSLDSQWSPVQGAQRGAWSTGKQQSMRDLVVEETVLRPSRASGWIHGMLATLSLGIAGYIIYSIVFPDEAYVAELTRDKDAILHGKSVTEVIRERLANNMGLPSEDEVQQLRKQRRDDSIRANASAPSSPSPST
jgi:hypothetical protein